MTRTIFTLLLCSTLLWNTFAQEAPAQEKAFLGVDIEVNDNNQIEIVYVLPEGSAKSAGMQTGDILVGVNGIEHKEIEDLVKAIQNLTPGEKASFTVLRGEEKLTLETVMGVAPKEEKVAEPKEETPKVEEKKAETSPKAPNTNTKGKKAFLGVEFAPTPQGLMVAGLVPGGAAEKAGMQKNDLLVGFNQKRFKNPRTMIWAIGQLTPGETTTFHVIREGQLMDIDVVLGEATAEIRKPAPKEMPKAPHSPRKPGKKAPAPKKEKDFSKGAFTPISLSVQEETLANVFNQIFEKSGGNIQYLSLSQDVLRSRLSLSVRNLGALYVAQYACLVSEVAFRAEKMEDGKMLFLIYPHWDEKGKQTASQIQSDTSSEKRLYLGLDLAESLTDKEKESYGSDGAMVLEVLQFSPAAEAGFQNGDLVVAVDGNQIASAQDLAEILTKSEEGKSHVFDVVRVTEGERSSHRIQATLGLDPAYHGLLTTKIQITHDEARLGNILEELSEFSKGRIQYVAPAATLARYRLSMRLHGVSIQQLLSYIFALIEWKYNIIQTSPEDYLILFTGETNRKD